MKVLTDNKYYSQIANVIREQNGTNNTYKPQQMVSALKDLFYEEVEGVPPITFQGIGENLLDYRIDGAIGGVGERTSNLFNCELENKTMDWETGKTNANSTNRITTTFFHLTSGTYFLNADILEEATIFHYSVDEIYKSASQWYTLPAVFTIDEDEKIKICFRKKDLSATPISENYNIIVREGSTATDYEPYGYKVPVVINGKNLLQNNATSQTKNGVTFTVNEDGSVTCNGTNHGNNPIIFELNNPNVVFPEGVYITSGCPAGGSITGGYKIQYFNGSSWNYELGSGNTFTLSGSLNYRSRILISTNVTVTNLTFYPMLRKADIIDDTYEPYIEPTTTNIYLDEPIGANESISLSDTNTNIPTIRGTNILTVDTTVQPSNVYVKARKEIFNIITPIFLNYVFCVVWVYYIFLL